MWRSVHFRRTTILTVGCVALLFGLGCSRWIAGFELFIVIIFGLFCSLLLRRKDWLSVVGIIIFATSLGLYRGHAFLDKTQIYQEFNGQKVTVDVVAETDASYDEHRQLSFDAKQTRLIQPQQRKLVGSIRISGFGVNSVLRGNKVRAAGKMYVTRGSKQASISFAELTVLNATTSKLDNFRREFSAGLATMLPEPLGSFGLGLLIGQKTALSQEVITWLSIVGLTHIIAVSGYNLTIIIRFVHRAFGKRSRYQTAVVSLITISTFLLITGFSASITRAAIVCGLSLLCWYYGRTVRPLLLILFTAAFTAFWYPIYVWSDIGWYLSFLAFFGVMILAPLLTRRLCKRQPKPLTQVVIESFCAQIMTLPIILFIFKQASLIALISNILVVPLVPLAMLLTLLAGLVGIFLPSFGILVLPTRLLLTYILDVAHLLSRIPGAVVRVQTSIVITIVLYAIVTVVCLVLWHAKTRNYGTITDENDVKMELI